VVLRPSGVAAALSLALILPSSAGGQTRDLGELSIEDLMNVRVISVSKKEQDLFGVPSAVFVLTNETIRRSGATSIPDALRLVPGMQVAQIDGNKWAISARGFNGVWANKLLVLIDGRVVYTPVSGGVYWDLQDFPLDDIDRIEVIRGPGSTVWGANAVNGVVNIISKSSAATQGGLATVSTGTTDPAIASIRYGGRLASRGHYRFFVKNSNRGAMTDTGSTASGDQSRLTQAGFRSDMNLSPTDVLTVQGSILNGESGQRVNRHLESYTPVARVVVSSISPIRVRNLVARWERSFSPQSSFSMQAFWDHSYRLVIGKGETNQTIDLELQHRFAAGKRHDVIWGAGHRASSDHLEVVFAEYFDPANSRTKLSNVFLQDEIALVPGRLKLTFGSKLEHNTFAGFELQPTARIAWHPTGVQTVWGAISRAARTPSRLERSLHVDVAAFIGAGGQLTVIGIRGAADLKTEHVNAFETGYRIEPHPGLAFDVTAFYNQYDDLRTENAATIVETTGGPPRTARIRQYTSSMSGKNFGAEMLARWQVAPVWRLDAQYNRLQTDLKNIGTTPEATLFSDRNPRQQWQVRSQVNLTRTWQFDASLAHVGRLQSVDIPAYSRVDARLGGSLGAGINLSLVGQNLTNSRHLEFAGFEGVHFSEVRRNVYLKATWHF
jgi:iron complex outermembrane recepter protein